MNSGRDSLLRGNSGDRTTKTIVTSFPTPTLQACKEQGIQIANKKKPELLKTASSPLDGEPTARTHVVAVILAKGTYAVFDNNSQAQIVRDGTNAANASWVYRYINGRVTYSEPIYAATCVYYPAGVANECKCGAPLPRETSTMMEPGATGVVASASGACATDYSGKFTQAKSNVTISCGPCTDTTVVCINKMLILTVPDPNGSVPG
ncbi:hypothetical protein PRIPAC_80706 [Pristionchus pacificus]|uniref:Uncharacterized protein n=1 Tax=Pristionchus pacificus TaxID=54126 RepID=A0A2A6CQ35_PRIPA|nr:hypothetical protein PRIPAC_80706 [Pristionchus pacificus]|eukprot:PDM80230.1 hypothetical protein PRIPAC_32809 [Pristionchus pacificus]